MRTNVHSAPPRRALVSRFWATGLGLAIGLIAIVLIQLFVQYRLNVWNRDLFNAIEKKDGEAVLLQAFARMRSAGGLRERLRKVIAQWQLYSHPPTTATVRPPRWRWHIAAAS
jgi:ABC-type uncharacterized transport system fused permease/ATPase subunit